MAPIGLNRYRRRCILTIWLVDDEMCMRGLRMIGDGELAMERGNTSLYFVNYLAWFEKARMNHCVVE
jgi:hypothetical protein